MSKIADHVRSRSSPRGAGMSSIGSAHGTGERVQVEYRSVLEAHLRFYSMKERKTNSLERTSGE